MLLAPSRAQEGVQGLRKSRVCVGVGEKLIQGRGDTWAPAVGFTRTVYCCDFRQQLLTSQDSPGVAPDRLDACAGFLDSRKPTAQGLCPVKNMLSGKLATSQQEEMVPLPITSAHPPSHLG